MRAACLFGALLVSASLAFSRGLDDGDRIDAVFIHEQTGQPALLLAIDKPVNSEAVEKQLDYKLGTYIGFVRSGDLYAKYPKAKPQPAPLLILFFEEQPSPRVRDMTFRARDRLLSMGFEVELKVYDEANKRNVDLAP